jgi:SAM-dependent methyltransferase
MTDKREVPRFTEAYHLRQWDTCYDSTRAFYDFLDSAGVLGDELNGSVLDLCCGSGANLFWLKKRHPGLDLIGVEIAPELVEFGNRTFAERGVDGVRLEAGDVYAYDGSGLPALTGVVAMQTVSFLPDEVGFMDTATSLGADWIAMTGLMTPGSHTFRTVINDHEDPDHGVNYYNTFSVDYLRSLFVERGYGHVITEPFQIGIDLPRPRGGGLGTYTEKTDDGRRLQISGALCMNWNFLLARR